MHILHAIVSSAVNASAVNAVNSQQHKQSQISVNMWTWNLEVTDDQVVRAQKSLTARWLEQASQWHEMYCHDLEIMSSNSSRVELGVLGTSVLINKSYLNKNIKYRLLTLLLTLTTFS